MDCYGAEVLGNGIRERRKVLLIIPSYNEAKNIGGVLAEIKDAQTDVDYLVIDDGSTDDTKQILQKKKSRYLSLPVNLGIGGAVQAGYQYAASKEYDIAIQFDGDGQHDARYLPMLIKSLDEGADIAIGSRFIDKEGDQSSAFRRAGIRVLSFFVWACTRQKIADVTSGFRAVNKRFIKFYANHYPQDYPEPEAIVSAVVNGGVIREVPVVMRKRAEGKSSIAGVKKSFFYMIKVCLAILLCRVSVRKEG